MSPFKIRDKKPKDSIKEKVPKKNNDIKIRHKEPAKYDESFELPPRKQNKEKIIPKKEIFSPSNQGTRNKQGYDSTKSNIPPPILEKLSRQRNKENILPSSKGYVPKKFKDGSANKTIPIKKTKKVKISIIPSSSGSKKTRGIVNKPPSFIKNKKPKKVTIPTSLSSSSKTKQNRIISKNPPKKIESKTPSKKKIRPPPTFKERIPKTQIKKKKPH
ncbi:MAG: hypothetical protein ACXACU_01860 [Candidatus Hodarchaeales archaeon]